MSIDLVRRLDAVGVIIRISKDRVEKLVNHPRNTLAIRYLAALVPIFRRGPVEAATSRLRVLASSLGEDRLEHDQGLVLRCQDRILFVFVRFAVCLAAAPELEACATFVGARTCSFLLVS